jgi:hypothetical protein
MADRGRTSTGRTTTVPFGRTRNRNIRGAKGDNELLLGRHAAVRTISDSGTSFRGAKGDNGAPAMFGDALVPNGNIAMYARKYIANNAHKP